MRKPSIKELAFEIFGGTKLFTMADVRVLHIIVSNLQAGHAVAAQLSMKEIIEKTGLSRTSVSASINNLMQHGVLDRSGYSHRKARTYTLKIEALRELASQA